MEADGGPRLASSRRCTAALDAACQVHKPGVSAKVLLASTTMPQNDGAQ